MRKIVGATLMALALLSTFAAPAFAQSSEYPPSGDDLTVSNGSPDAGGDVTVSGSGCAAGAEVTITVDGAAAGTTTADDDGNFTATVRIPSGASGQVDITATCADPSGGTHTLTSTVTVASGGGSDSGGLPFTGSGSVPLILVALALLGVGAVFVVAGRRRSGPALDS